jgi:hypothetical protein
MSATSPTIRPTRWFRQTARGGVSRFRSKRHEAAYAASVEYSFGLMALRSR